MRNDFYLSDEIIYLNHGSFGACPKAVMNAYQKFQINLEENPFDMIVRKSENLFEQAREKVANFLGTSHNNIVFVPNTTMGLNIIANSLNLSAGDQVLTTNFEYGATVRMWQILAARKGFKYVASPISLPILDTKTFVNEFFSNANDATKVVFLSHITSATALKFPIEEVIKEAKKRGLITVIDGAHAPGQIQLNLSGLGADFYVGNFHKWVMAPKGTAFLYANNNAKKLLKPFIIGWGGIHSTRKSNTLIDENQFPGTRDFSAYLTVPVAISFLKKNITENKKILFAEMISFAKKNFEDIFKTSGISDAKDGLQMYAHPLPKNIDGQQLKTKLWEKYKIEIPVMEQNNCEYLRISVQVYTSVEEIKILIEALKKIIVSCCK